MGGPATGSGPGDRKWVLEQEVGLETGSKAGSGSGLLSEAKKPFRTTGGRLCTRLFGVVLVWGLGHTQHLLNLYSQFLVVLGTHVSTSGKPRLQPRS